jgi:hypothetical protein
MQRATCTGLHIRSPSDAEVIFHAVWLNILPIVTHRLDTEERSSISAGSVYVWEERCPYAEATGVGIYLRIVRSNPNLLPDRHRTMDRWFENHS